MFEVISNDVGTGCLTLLGFLLNILFISVSPSQGTESKSSSEGPCGVFLLSDSECFSSKLN